MSIKINNAASYIFELQVLLGLLSLNDIRTCTNTIIETWKNQGKIIAIGNGSSVSIASNLISELTEAAFDFTTLPFHGRTLSDNIGLFTVYPPKDIYYEDSFPEQLKHIFNINDLVIRCTSSGNSKNIVNALIMQIKLARNFLLLQERMSALLQNCIVHNNSTNK